MFRFLSQLLKFWFVIILVSMSAYMLIFNQERIFVNLPGIGAFRVMAAVAFLMAFALGATTVLLYFGFEFFRKSWETKRLHKRLSTLETHMRSQGINPSEVGKSWFGRREPAVVAKTDSEV